MPNIFEPAIFAVTVVVPKLATQKTAYVLQLLQSGQIRTYASLIVFGATALLVYTVLRGV